MKSTKTSVTLAAFLLLAVAVNFIRAATIWAGSYVSVNNTTWNSPTNGFTTVNIPSPVFTFYLSNNLARLTDVTLNHFASLDGVNWTNDWSYVFPSTNAGAYATNPGTLTMTVFGRMQIVDTNQNYVAITSNP